MERIQARARVARLAVGQLDEDADVDVGVPERAVQQVLGAVDAARVGAGAAADHRREGLAVVHLNALALLAVERQQELRELVPAHEAEEMHDVSLDVVGVAPDLFYLLLPDLLLEIHVEDARGNRHCRGWLVARGVDHLCAVSMQVKSRLNTEKLSLFVHAFVGFCGEKDFGDQTRPLKPGRL